MKMRMSEKWGESFITKVLLFRDPPRSSDFAYNLVADRHSHLIT